MDLMVCAAILIPGHAAMGAYRACCARLGRPFRSLDGHGRPTAELAAPPFAPRLVSLVRSWDGHLLFHQSPYPLIRQP